MCGFHVPFTPTAPIPTLHADYILTRRNAFTDSVASLPKILLKDKTVSAFVSFLASLNPPSTLAAAEPISQQIRNTTTLPALIRVPLTPKKRTFIRCDATTCSLPTRCPHRLSEAHAKLLCPKRASPTSIQTHLSHLRTGLHAAGWTEPWSPISRTGNPADSHLVRSYIEFLQREGQSSLLAPVQATPVFPHKLAIAVSHWSYVAHDARQRRLQLPLEPYTRLVALQNIAFCLLTSEAGYRGADIDRLDPKAITWLPDGSGIHIALYTGKTIKAGIIERIVIRSHSTPSTCVIHALREYARESHLLGYPLLAGLFVFPSITSTTYDTTSSVTYPVMQHRLVSALRTCNSYVNETIHGLRVAAAISAVVAPDSIPAVMTVGHWRSPQTAARYSQLASAVSPQTPVTLLSWQRSLVQWCRDLPSYFFFNSLTFQPQ
ncbi:hypothetical protein BC829DRAFT_414976 [Chytridium lagenaria]|nr:hypothetical protein BC829DRAFT_414976 [Chytridium lagenaria]